MYCSKCGTMIDDAAMYCSMCGAKTENKLKEELNETASYTYSPEEETPSKQENVITHYAPKSFADVFHTQGRSLTFLIASALATVYCLSVLIGNVFTLSNSYGSDRIQDFLELLNTIVKTGLICPALWIIFVSSKKPKLPEMSITSMLLIKINTIITIVSFSLSMLFLIIVSLAMFSGKDILNKLLYSSGFYLGNVDLGFVGGVILVTSLIVSVFFYSYMIMFLKIINNISNGLKYNNIKEIKYAKIYAFLTYVYAGLYLFIVLTGFTFISLLPYFDMTAFSFLMEIIYPVILILFATLISRINKNHILTLDEIYASLKKPEQPITTMVEETTEEF